MTSGERKRLRFTLVSLVVAAVTLWLDQRLFLFFAAFLLIHAIQRLDYLRAMIRVYQVANEARAMAIARHLDVPESVFDELLEGAFAKEPPEHREAFNSDLSFIRSGF